MLAILFFSAFKANGWDTVFWEFVLGQAFQSCLSERVAGCGDRIAEKGGAASRGDAHWESQWSVPGSGGDAEPVHLPTRCKPGYLVGEKTPRGSTGVTY